MLTQAQRSAILEMNSQRLSIREIARVLGLSRQSVRHVLRSKSVSVPEIQRPEKAEPYRQQILDLLNTCKGNLVRVHEELSASGAVLSYQALTAFCRRQQIGKAPVMPAGRYHFEPGVEMQHDTLRMTWKWAARSARHRRHRLSCATRACCSSNSAPPFSDSIAKCF